MYMQTAKDILDPLEKRKSIENLLLKVVMPFTTGAERICVLFRVLSAEAKTCFLCVRVDRLNRYVVCCCCCCCFFFLYDNDTTNGFFYFSFVGLPFTQTEKSHWLVLSMVYGGLVSLKAAMAPGFLFSPRQWSAVSPLNQRLRYVAVVVFIVFCMLWW